MTKTAETQTAETQTAKLHTAETHTSKPRIALDLPDLSAYRPRPAPASPERAALTEEAANAGFRTRHAISDGGEGGASATGSRETGPETKPFDARSLRRSRRTAQLNIALEQATRERFWALAQTMDVTSGEEILARLMDAFETRSDG